MMVGGWAFDLSWGGPEAKLLLTSVSLSQRKHRLWEQTFKLLKEHYKKVRKLQRISVFYS